MLLNDDCASTIEHCLRPPRSGNWQDASAVGLSTRPRPIGRRHRQASVPLPGTPSRHRRDTSLRSARARSDVVSGPVTAPCPRPGEPATPRAPSFRHTTGERDTDSRAGCGTQFEARTTREFEDLHRAHARVVTTILRALPLIGIRVKSQVQLYKVKSIHKQQTTVRKPIENVPRRPVVDGVEIR